jgi:spore germination cell wall hydrolase CwlJ-like protein
MIKPLKATLFLIFSALFATPVVAEEQENTVTLTSVMQEIESKILELVVDIAEPEMPEIYTWEYKSLDKEILCLAQNIYFEAGHEPHMGKVAVGLVTINRVKSPMYPDSICEVVWQVGKSSKTGKSVAQFSWTRDGKPDRPRNMTAWGEALELARDMIGDADLNEYEDFTKGATHYHATYVKPYWRHKYERVAKIGLHIFYRDVNQVYEGSVAKL